MNLKYKIIIKKIYNPVKSIQKRYDNKKKNRISIVGDGFDHAVLY
jgi:hypothetical protein